MDRVSCHSKQNDKTDDIFSIVCGDLGLGEGLKPGGLLQCEDGASCQCAGQTEPIRLNRTRRSNSCEERGTPLKQSSPGRLKSLVVRNRSKSKSFEYEDNGQVETEENFPSYADIPLGTSLRQQKKLFEQNLGSILKKHGQSVCLEPGYKTSDDHNEQSNSNRKRLTSEEIEKKLISAIQEVEELNIELDTCKRRLDAKYKAIAILKQQAEEFANEFEHNEKKAREYSQVLAQEVNKLQFELEWREASFMDSQQTWAVRFDRVCQENGLLMATLEARSEELRQSNSRKMALARERDELLALLDVREKLKYEKSKSQIPEDEYGMYSSAELAVLGACKCRGTKPEPCGCAHAAANLRREIARLRDEIELYKHRRDEAYLTVDAYRKAFEEQLQKNKFMTIKLAELAAPASSKAVKVKAAIKWLISVLNDDDLPPIADHQNSKTENGPQSPDVPKSSSTALMSPQELVTLLTEMLHEKAEALAHQKLAAQVLASKTQVLEKQLAAKEEDILS